MCVCVHVLCEYVCMCACEYVCMCVCVCGAYMSEEIRTCTLGEGQAPYQPSVLYKIAQALDRHFKLTINLQHTEG